MRGRIAIAAIVLGLCSVAGACPNCKSALDQPGVSGGGTAELSKGFYVGTLAMVAAPYALIGAIAFGVRRSLLRSKPTGL